MYNNGSSSGTKRPRLTVDQICSNVASAAISEANAASSLSSTSKTSPSKLMSSSTSNLQETATTTAASATNTVPVCEAMNLSLSGRHSVQKTASTESSPSLSPAASTPTATETIGTTAVFPGFDQRHSWSPDRAPPSRQLCTPQSPDIEASTVISKPEASKPSSVSSDDGGKERRRRQKLTNKDNLFCQVCGDKANGYNFGAITCESCKAFFRRNALKNKDLRCNFDNSCKIDHFTRKFCTACRLRKCFAVNMKKEWILDEDALKKRKKLTRRSSVKDEGSSSDYETLPFPTMPTSQMFGASNMPAAHAPGLFMYLDPVSIVADTPSDDKDYPPLPLSEDDHAEIERIMTSHALIDDSSSSPPSSNKEDTGQSSSGSAGIGEASHGSPASASGGEDSSQEAKVLSIADGFIRKLIKFVKTLPGYRDLIQLDQIALLKGGIMETLIIRSAILQSPTHLPYTERSAPHGLEELFREHCKLTSTFNAIARWDKPVLVLAMIINLFNPDRAGVINKEQVRLAGERYSLLLQAYLRSKTSFFEARAIYPQIFLKLNEVHLFGEMCAQHIARVKPSELQPLMRELFSMK